MSFELGDDLLLATDPVAWAHLIAGPVIKGWNGALDVWQMAVLRSVHRNIILKCSRQAGKSTVTAVKASHMAIYRPSSMVLIVSKKEEQASLLFQTIDSMVDAHEKHFGIHPKKHRVESNKSSIKLRNGSFVKCAVGKEETIRGFSSVDLLILDEAAYVPDEVHMACLPMLRVSKGQQLLLSTPNGMQGFFFRSWTVGAPEWERYEVTWRDCPRISAQDVEKDRKAHGDMYIRQEYEGAFLATLDSVFTADQISRSIVDAEEFDV